jgi:thiol-disulfide isomerase/thioredoxin
LQNALNEKVAKRVFDLNITDWLSKEEFTRLAASSDPKIMLFAAHWCGYCSRFLETVRRYNAPDDIEINLVDVDDPDESLWDDYGIALVPTLVVFKSSRQLARRDARSGVGLLEDDLKDVVGLFTSKE